MLIREFLKTYQTTPTCTTSTGLGRKEQEMKESQPFKEHRPAFHDTLEVLHTVQGNDQDFVIVMEDFTSAQFVAAPVPPAQQPRKTSPPSFTNVRFQILCAEFPETGCGSVSL